MKSGWMSFFAILAFLPSFFGYAIAEKRSDAVETEPDTWKPIILVAKRGKPELGDYRESVVYAVPLTSGHHFGFIMNWPMPGVTVGKLFPNHAPSQKVEGSVHIGGPEYMKALYAVVQTTTSPGGRSAQLGPNLFAVMDAITVDRIIETEPKKARFFVGYVIWQVGELGAELKSNFWYTLKPEPVTELFFNGSPEKLWEELVGPLERKEKTF